MICKETIRANYRTQSDFQMPFSLHLLIQGIQEFCTLDELNLHFSWDGKSKGFLKNYFESKTLQFT
jgi:hypothetical protein